MEFPSIIKKPNVEYSVGCDVFTNPEGFQTIVFCVGHGKNEKFQIEHMGTFKPVTKQEYDIWVEAMSKFFNCKLIIDNKK